MSIGTSFSKLDTTETNNNMQKYAQTNTFFCYCITLLIIYSSESNFFRSPNRLAMRNLIAPISVGRSVGRGNSPSSDSNRTKRFMLVLMQTTNGRLWNVQADTSARHFVGVCGTIMPCRQGQTDTRTHATHTRTRSPVVVVVVFARIIVAGRKAIRIRYFWRNKTQVTHTSASTDLLSKNTTLPLSPIHYYTLCVCVVAAAAPLHQNCRVGMRVCLLYCADCPLIKPKRCLPWGRLSSIGAAFSPLKRCVCIALWIHTRTSIDLPVRCVFRQRNPQLGNLAARACSRRGCA